MRRWLPPVIAVCLTVGYAGATRLERRRMETTTLQPAVAGPAAPHRIDGARAFAVVQALSAPEMEGRQTGTPGNHRAQAFIVARFRQLGVPALGGGYEQKFSFVHRSVIGTVMPGRPAKRPYPDATNLIAIVRGTAQPEHVLIVSAHYDHLGVRDGRLFPGADDNASGVAAMLETAAYVVAHPLRLSVVFVAFDGEEQGLQGSQYFVAHSPIPLDRVGLVINLDMVSRSDTGSIVASGTWSDPSLKSLVLKAAEGRRLSVAFGHDRPIYLAGGIEDWTHQSDQGPFHDAGVRTLYYGVEDHPDYHQPTDTADKIPRPFFDDVCDLVVQTVLGADGG
jgi:peptidase M28-like protein